MHQREIRAVFCDFKNYTGVPGSPGARRTVKEIITAFSDRQRRGPIDGRVEDPKKGKAGAVFIDPIKRASAVRRVGGGTSGGAIKHMVAALDQVIGLHPKFH